MTNKNIMKNDTVSKSKYLAYLWLAQHSNSLRKIVGLAVALLAVAAFVAGCQSEGPQFSRLPGATDTILDTNTNQLTLREGDIVKITFPGAPALDATQQVRRDGKISLAGGGEMQAAGLTTSQLESQVLKKYSDQLVSKEVTVSIESSSFPVFVTGAVLRPGEISSDRPITALEAIMKAGGFDYSKANLKSVTIVRHEGKEVRNFKVNLKLPLEGKPSEPFYLKPSDIVFVPERFTWF